MLLITTLIVNPAFLHRCIDFIDPSISTLLCGDFNTVLDRVVNRRSSCPFDPSRESSILLSVFFRNRCVVLKHLFIRAQSQLNSKATILT